MPKLTHEEANRRILKAMGYSDGEIAPTNQNVLDRLADPKVRENMGGAMKKFLEDKQPIGRPKKLGE